MNDPVSLDSVPAESHGQASRISATAEQFGGALGMAAFYLLLHSTCVVRLHALIETSPQGQLTSQQYDALRQDIEAAEQTGLHADAFDPAFRDYLDIVFEASANGFAVAFAGSTLVALLGLLSVALLVRRAGGTPLDVSSPHRVFAAAAAVHSAAVHRLLPHRPRHR